MTSVRTFQAAQAYQPELRRLVPLLPAPERLVLSLRLGLDGRGPRSVSDVARLLAWRESDVRLAEGRGLARLDHPALAGKASLAA